MIEVKSWGGVRLIIFSQLYSTMAALLLQLEAQSLNSVVAGFSFASALAWYEVVKSIVAKVIKTGGSGLQHDVIAALFTTLLAIVVFMVVKMLAFNVKLKDPQETVFAVTR